MDGILITILIVTGFLIYKLISSSRKQEGYKRWKATGSGNTTNEETSKNKWEHGAWLRHALGVVTPKMRTCPVFDEEAVVWCANLLGIEVMRLKEILQDVSSHYREFWIRKRRGGYRMISAPDKELKAIQDTIYHRILLSVNVHPAATGFRRQHSIVDNVRPHLGKRCVLKTDILITLLIVAISLLLLGVKVFFTKGGKFPNGHVSGNKELRKKGIGCAQSQDREAQKKSRFSIDELEKALNDSMN